MSARSIAALAVLALGAALAGCPLPQPLPDYPAGVVTPPRILSASTTQAAESIIPVPAGCANDVFVDLGARIFYQDSDAIQARWFVDYKRDSASRYAIQKLSDVLADPDTSVLERDVPGFRFHPYGFPPPPELGLGSDPKAPGVLHVVELVVSNGFDPSETAPEPNRSPAAIVGGTTFEIQTHRWVFVSVAPSAAVPCP